MNPTPLVDDADSARPSGCSCAPHSDAWAEIRCLRAQISELQTALAAAEGERDWLKSGGEYL